MPIGKIEPFIIGAHNWDAYCRRMKQFIALNSIAEELHVATLVTHVGIACYELMCDLCAPSAPETKSFEELERIVKEHLEPQRSEIAERHVFRQRKQGQDENINEYLQSLKHLAKTCNFGTTLEVNLRDQFVSGLLHEDMRSRLFAERELDYKRAVELALALEAADRHAALAASGTSSGGTSGGAAEGMHRVARARGSRWRVSGGGSAGGADGAGAAHAQLAPGGSVGGGGGARCGRCGKEGHAPSRCRFKMYTCDRCGEKGHLKAVCRKSLATKGKIFDELHEGYDTGYNSDVNPTITNSFATAVFHFLNSLLDQDVEFVDDKRQSVTSSRLADSYFKPGILLQKGLNKILDGMIKEKSQELDFNYDDDLRNRWLGGLDVLAVDIQRGRDHGLPGYNQYRTLASLSPATTFQDLSDNIPHEMIEKLSKVYQHPNDIDLVVGMLAEEPLPSSLLGATATYLLKEQLWRTRAGDRYFYSHMDEAGSFSKRQLSEIRRASLPRLLCDNAGFVTVQRDVFQPSSDSNPTVSCEEIKKLNFEAWQDPSTQPDIFTRTNKWIKNKVGTGNSTNAK